MELYVPNCDAQYTINILSEYADYPRLQSKL